MRMNTHLAFVPPPRKKSGDDPALPTLPPSGLSPDPVLATVADLLDRASASMVELAIALGDAAHLVRRIDG